MYQKEENNNSEEIDLKTLMQNQLLKYAEELSTTYKNLKSEHKLLVDSYYQTIMMGFDLITVYDELLGGHCKRIARYAENLAKALDMDFKTRTNVKVAGLLHDIGLIGIPKDILIKLKTGKERSKENLQLYRQHPMVSVRPISTSPSFKDVARVIGAHHENVDGSGFPEGLSGTWIPVGSRIIAIVNDYDNIKQLSPAALESKDVIDILEHDVGSKYDPKIFREFKIQILGNDPFSVVKDVVLEELIPGVILAKSIHTENDTVVLSAETILEKEDIERIKKYAELTKLKMPIRVYKH